MSCPVRWKVGLWRVPEWLAACITSASERDSGSGSANRDAHGGMGESSEERTAKDASVAQASSVQSGQSKSGVEEPVIGAGETNWGRESAASDSVADGVGNGVGNGVADGVADGVGTAVATTATIAQERTFYGVMLGASLASGEAKDLVATKSSSLLAGVEPAAKLQKKQERSKTQSNASGSANAAGVVAAVLNAGVDPTRIQALSLPGGQAGSQDREVRASDSTGKSAGEISRSTQAKTQEALGGAMSANGRADGGTDRSLDGSADEGLDGGFDGGLDGSAAASAISGLDAAVLPQAQDMTFRAGLDLQMASGSLGNPSVGRQNIGLDGTAGQSISSAADAATAAKANDAVSSIKSAVAAGEDGSSHAGADGSQAAQGAPGDLSKASAALTKAVGDASMQASLQAASAHAAAHGIESAPYPANGANGDRGTTGAARKQELPASPQAAAEEGAATSSINTAKVIQSMGETEMHVGMHTEEFGDISIRTSISDQQMLAQISLDHSDLSQAISMQAPMVQARLEAEYGWNASIQINSQGAPLSGDSGNASQREQGSYGRSSGAKQIAPVALAESNSTPMVMTGAGSGGGLDIRV